EKLVASGGGDCAETTMRDKLAGAAVTVNPRMLLQASRTLKRGRPGRLVADPTVQLRDAFVPLTLLTQRSTLPIRYSLIGPDKHLVNVLRASLLASCRRSGGPRRHAGGRRSATAARRACRRLVILEVRRVLELVLGPADFELDHGGIVVAADYGGIAASAGAAAAGVGGNRLECAHIDSDTLFTDAEESAHTHNQPEDLAVLVEQHVTHIANVCVVGAEHIGPFELGENPLVRALRRDEFRGVMRGGVGFRHRRRWRRRFWGHIGLRQGA